MNRSVLLIWLTLGVSIKSIRDSTSAVIRIVLLPKFIALNYYTAKLSPNPMSLLLSSCHFHHLPQQRKSHTLDDNQSITPVHHRVQFRQSSANYFPVMIFICLCTPSSPSDHHSFTRMLQLLCSVLFSISFRSKLASAFCWPGVSKTDAKW